MLYIQLADDILFLVSSHVRNVFVRPHILAAAPGWAASFFSGATAVALRAGLAGTSIDELGGRVLEGWRASATGGAQVFDSRAATTPVYRQSNIGRLKLVLDPEHWVSPEIEGPWCVKPGDVVVNKLAPLRAAIVSPVAKRHPVDGNTLIIRELAPAAATWVTLCLIHSGYEHLVLTGSGVLNRVGLRALSALRLPPVPPKMESLAVRLRDLLDDQAIADEELYRVRAEANELACATQIAEHSLRKGAYFSCSSVAHENWLPWATALRTEQAELAEELGWVAIADLATWGDRTRVTHALENVRTLRLRDVGEDAFISVAADANEALIASRILARPLLPGEVLLSTLGSSSRTAYVDDDAPRNTYPTDGWVRLRFRETPAAWALLLSTDALRSQAARLAVGSVQQFVPPDALRSLRIPVPTREVRERWQRAVDRHHAQRRVHEQQWAELMGEMTAVFEAIHRPFAERHLREEEVE